MIRNLKLKNFTAFKDLELNFSPKLNLIIGANASGKTHILKVIYASLNGLEQASWDDKEKNSILQANRCITESLIGVFKPDDKLGKLKKISSGRELKAEVSLQCHTYSSCLELDYSFNSNSKQIQVKERDYEAYFDYSSIRKPIFIPAKEIISLLYEVYDSDLISRNLVDALTPSYRKDLQLHEKSKWILEKIENLLGGKFVFF
jgi:predicted ATP-dependent endonuclease of OLD family